MSLDDWMLALHVLSAFTLVAGIVIFWVVIVASWRTNTPGATIDIGRLADAGNTAIGVGWGGTIVLGIWLAFSVGGYEVWDGWIIAALALWALSLPLGQRTSATYEEGVKKAHELLAKGQTGPSPDLLALNRAPKGAVAHFLTSVIVLLVLTDMIWKPGA